MEPDGITRVYVTGSRNTAWEQFPVRTDVPQEMIGVAAQAILSRADFRGEIVSLKAGDVPGTAKHPGYNMRDLSTDEPFYISIVGHEFIARHGVLAKALEKKAGKKGLTIVVR